MKAFKTLFSILIMVSVFSSCKKDSAVVVPTDSPKTIFSSTFGSQTDLNAWTQSSGGMAIIDSNAVKFDSITSCYSFETSNLIPVVKGKTYELKLKGKVNSSIVGDPGFCVGDFMIYVVQGSTNIIAEGFGNYPSYTTKSYSFEATSSASIKIKFLIGASRGAWIDNIELIEN
jgi:hypothetical protein